MGVKGLNTEQTKTYHKSPHSLFLNPLLFLLLLSVCNGVIAHHSSVKLHHLGLDGTMIFSEVTGMLQYCVQVLLMLLSTFAFLFHLLLLFKFLCNPEGQKE